MAHTIDKSGLTGCGFRSIRAIERFSVQSAWRAKAVQFLVLYLISQKISIIYTSYVCVYNVETPCIDRKSKMQQ